MRSARSDCHNERSTKLLPLVLAFYLLPLLPAAAQVEEAFQVCIGDRDECHGAPWFSCGTSIEQAAQAVCTTHTKDTQIVSRLNIKKLSDRPGGQCGYAVFVVTCKR